jgi:peptide/nickel transport system ATP-binding protein
MSERDDALLEVADVTVTYPRGARRAPLTALSDASLFVGRGETVSVVGESGSGKTTLGSAILGLQPVASGSIMLHGQDIAHLGNKQRQALRSSLQAIFQDPFGSLDPSMTVGDTVAEPLHVAERGLAAQEVAHRTESMLERVGIETDAMQRYPAEFSGGQRQRIAIARALILNPEVVVCDEAVSALDVSVQAQVLNLLGALQRENGTSYVFITHNMAVVQYISDRVLVLYRGRVMEDGSVDDVCGRPAHPYTRSLVSAVPVPDVAIQSERRRIRARTSISSVSGVAVGGDAADATGCPFAPRCPFAQRQCVVATPPLIDIGDGRKAACVRINEIPAADQIEGLVRPRRRN